MEIDMTDSTEVGTKQEELKWLTRQLKIRAENNIHPGVPFPRNSRDRINGIISAYPEEAGALIQQYRDKLIEPLQAKIQELQETGLGEGKPKAHGIER